MTFQKKIKKPDTIISSHADSIIKDAHSELKNPARRLFGKQILTLGGIAMLTGCDFSNDQSVDTLLHRMSLLNDNVQALLFDPKRMAPTYAESMITRPFPFNAFYDLDDVPDIDPASYRLRLGGLANGKGVWTLDELRACRRKARSHAMCVSKAGVPLGDGVVCASPIF